RRCCGWLSRRCARTQDAGYDELANRVQGQSRPRGPPKLDQTNAIPDVTRLARRTTMRVAVYERAFRRSPRARRIAEYVVRDGRHRQVDERRCVRVFRASPWWRGCRSGAWVGGTPIR